MEATATRSSWERTRAQGLLSTFTGCADQSLTQLPSCKNTLNREPMLWKANGGCGVSSSAGMVRATEPGEALHLAELEDMCQEYEDWKWQEEIPSVWDTVESTKGVVCDTTTGKVLDHRKVAAGRQEDFDWMQRMHVWDRVPRNEAISKGDGKFVGTRWV